MAWARLDDGWHDHPKVVSAGPEAAGVWAMCLTWAYRNRRASRTPGVVPEAVVTRFAGSRVKRVTQVLQSVGLLDEATPDGWPIHDFEDYLPAYDPEQAREAGRKGGQVKRTVKRTASKPLSEPTDEPPSEPEADGEQTAKRTQARVDAGASARRNPVPIPKKDDPDSLRESGARDTRARPKRRLPEDWAPNDSHQRYADEHGIDLDHEANQFRSHADANDRRQADWNAAFRTWLGNNVKWQPRATPEPAEANGFQLPAAPKEVIDDPDPGAYVRWARAQRDAWMAERSPA